MEWPTFILDIANNHGGSLDNAKRIVDEHAEVLHRHYAVNTAFKLQYRDLAHYQHGDEGYRKKFQDAYLSWADYARLVAYIRSAGFLVAVTAFDPAAAGWMDGVDYAKVASCSARDWRTIDAIAERHLPTIFSTAALSWDGMDNIVSYAEHRGMAFALMHCVATYPSKLEDLNLQRIARMKERYPALTVGFSTHENPIETGPVQMAWAYGARIFEKHVGLEGCNAYSSTPRQLGAWLYRYEEASEMGEYQGQDGSEERKALAKVTRQGIDGTKFPHPLKYAVHRAKASLNIAKIALPTDLTVDFSHHYGQGNFWSYGAVLITMVNRDDYAKKLIVVQSSQAHPSHYHRHKEETFQVLHGRLWLDIEGHVREMGPGELATVLPGQWHCFAALEDHTIFEEISTTALPGDSVYRDPLIMSNKNRKTTVKHWGRFEFG